MTACVGCEELFDEDDLAADHNGGLACRDCLADWAALDDAREWSWWQYAA